MSVEERLQRSRKAASIRKMLTQSTGFLDSIGSQAGMYPVLWLCAVTGLLQASSEVCGAKMCILHLICFLCLLGERLNQ